MPTQYIGRHSFFKGKSLFQIALNLKHFGVGRVVYRVNHMERYKERSYFRLTKVVPDMTSEFRHLGVVYGQKMFRGVDYGKVKIDSGHKFDWMLVPKDQEESFCLSTTVTPEKRVVPRMQQLPATMELYVKQIMQDEGLEAPDKILIKNEIRHNLQRLQYRRAEEDEITES